MTTTTSTVSEHFPTLTGRQEPHLMWRSPGSSEHGSKAITLSTRMRARPMPWQEASLDAILAKNPDGSWTHSDCCIICPRQNGKSLILSLRIIYGLLVLGETIVFTAQRWTTAEDIYKRTVEMIQSRPTLWKRVKGKPTCSQGRGIIETVNGGKVVFTTRSQDAGRGLTKLDLVIFDEAYNLTEGEMSALGPAQLAALDPQTIYASSAVNQEEQANGQVLAAVRRRGMDHEPEMYFAEFMAPPEMDRLDEETWKYANPSYGVIQTAKKIRKLMRGMSTARGRKNFDVEMLGRGDWPTEREFEAFSVISEETWSSMVNATPDLTGPIGIGLDRSLDRRWWAIAAAQRTTDGRIHVEVGYFQGGSHTEIVDLVVDLITAWDPCALVTDANSPAAVIEPQLLENDVELVKTTATQMVAACGGFYDDAVESPILSHTDQPVLTEAVEGAVKRTLPKGDWAWDRQADAVIAPLVAATLARWALVTYGSRQKTTKAARPSVQSDLSAYEHEFDALEAAF
ncbi:hypothetical protein ACTHQY_08980 [Rhodococcoides corynebacterioides]|uniref:hypothetical protein n=1 Tax=Rhodococcoides corynebacterioides TaxID=53972 RepID=UPI003F7F132B